MIVDIHKKLAVSVVIPTLGRPETLEETLDSYFSAEYIPGQIVIVDQTPDDNTRWKIKKIIGKYKSLSEITYYYQPVPSTTKSRNKGVELCNSDIIVFSDDDVTVEKVTIANVYKIMSDGDISMIAGINLNMKENHSKAGYIFFKKSYRNRNIGHVTISMLGRFPEKQIIGETQTQWAMGFFFVTRKSLVEKWNVVWDENLTGYAHSEDLDFSYSYYKKSAGGGINLL